MKFLKKFVFFIQLYFLQHNQLLWKHANATILEKISCPGKVTIEVQLSNNILALINTRRKAANMTELALMKICPAQLFDSKNIIDNSTIDDWKQFIYKSNQQNSYLAKYSDKIQAENAIKSLLMKQENEFKKEKGAFQKKDNYGFYVSALWKAYSTFICLTSPGNRSVNAVLVCKFGKKDDKYEPLTEASWNKNFNFEVQSHSMPFVILLTENSTVYNSSIPMFAAIKINETTSLFTTESYNRTVSLKLMTSLITEHVKTVKELTASFKNKERDLLTNLENPNQGSNNKTVKYVVLISLLIVFVISLIACFVSIFVAFIR